jgi:DNA mismatch endonuclease, patch repair protein
MPTRSRKQPSPSVPAVVSRRMSAIRKKNTRPEMTVRRLAYELGYRYRLHRADLPGTPDLCFARPQKVIFVHGCFWHQHHCKLGNKRPQTNQNYWLPKLERNVARDEIAQEKLRELGWDVLTIWECETTDQATLRSRLRGFLDCAATSSARRTARRPLPVPG